MKHRDAEVAVLLPTHNGVQFIEKQITSLSENKVRFTLHWLDDHSTDNSCDMVRNCTRSLGIELREWHQSERLNWPGIFYRLMECVEADIYMFCDQDDIWQPGKIDATVENLLPDAKVPALCFSHALMFTDEEPNIFRPVYDTLGVRIKSAWSAAKIFTINPAQGNTIGFTRPLRDIFVSHAQIARRYALSHDWWMYIIATACGAARLLPNVPTTLYRVHNNQACGMYSGAPTGWRGLIQVSKALRFQHVYRRAIALQAEGFCLAAPTMPSAEKLQLFLQVARLVAGIDRRQSFYPLRTLSRLGAMPPNFDWIAWLVVACLICDARVPRDSKWYAFLTQPSRFVD